MKTLLPSALILVLSFCACAPQYQLYNLSSVDAAKFVEDDVYFFTNDDLEIHYDFWTEGGLVLYSVYNKTESTLYLSLNQSRFILNRESIPYYPDDNKKTQNVPSGSKHFIMDIPPGKGKTIEGFPINYDWYKLGKNMDVRTFEKSNSPVIFRNQLTYSFEKDMNNPQSINNEFWVTGIQEMKNKEFKEFRKSLETKSDKFYVSKPSPFDLLFWLDVLEISAEMAFLIGQEE